MIAELLSEGGLSLERLQSFCLVAEAGGVTKAAKGDPARQSLFSRQIKELEEFFGTELIRRSGRGVSLTSAGERLNVLARDCFAGLWNFKTGCKHLPVEIVIGTGESIIRWLLMPSLVDLRKRLPKAKLKFLNLTTDQTVKQLSEGLIDFGVVRKGAVVRPLRSSAIGTVDYSLFLPAGSGAAEDRDARNLERLPLAVLEGEGTFRQALAAAVSKARVKLRIEIECSSFPLVANAVQTGGMAAVLPSMAAVEFRSDVEELKLPVLKSLGREICLAWNPRTLGIRTVLEQARKVLSEILHA